ncbi:MAG: GH92 family glycosyl hydrolase, partial [Crocinitomicaceae bacterium]
QKLQKSAYELVNPFIGTGGHGHTYPGATLPFGMVQLSPDTRLDGWDGCSGYHYTDSIIYGFSHTHLSGTGVPDYGDILLMPYQCDKTPTFQELKNHKVTPSQFSKSTEVAKPGYYEVDLENVNVKLTATEHVGIHYYNFSNLNDYQVLLDLNHRDKVLDYRISINGKSISGHRVSNAWATEQHVYFYMEFSAPFASELPKKQSTLPDYYRILNFSVPGPLMVKVGISATSVEGAKANLRAEADHWNFEKYRGEAKAKWEKALSKIEAKDQSEDKLSIFYSALYHTMIVPNTFSDVDGKYRGMDQKIHQDPTTDQYTVFSLWDTFRGAHPLYTIIEGDKTKAFIESFLNIYQQGGRLPVWELAGNETDCMIGYHAVPVIVDAYFKDYKDFDTELALKAMMHSANLNHLGLKAYKNKGFIAAGDEAESVSKTLEYAYDDWCIAQFAKALGKDSIYQVFIQRAQYYQNLFNPTTGFMQAKMNGAFAPGFDPAEVNFNFTEANAWQYSLFVPQDLTGLINLYGGVTHFEEHLDELFSTEMALSGRDQADITGLIGQYAHGNEPSHHMAYLYNYIGKPYKTQAKVHQILTEQYQNAPDGLSGNEDCGQMSAWYVLSSIGFYSVTPGLDYYTIGTPHLSEAKINLENGKSFTIKAHELSNNNFYIQSSTLNGRPYYKSYIQHSDIMDGGELIFKMGSKPNTKWGSEEENIPISIIADKHKICSVPYFETESQTFTDSLLIKIRSTCNDCIIQFSHGELSLEQYIEPFWIKGDEEITAWASCNNQQSKTITSNYKRIKPGRSIKIKSDYSNQYSAGGDNALIDYLRGSPNFRTGYWQGYQGQDVEFIVDLGSLQVIRSISVGCLQDIKSWIWYPQEIEISTSKFGKGYQSYGKIENTFGRDEYGAFTKDFSIDRTTKIQFIKVKLRYPGDCPEWHLGAGGKAWVFVDEIVVE